jgi:pilus assembly protein Flp/PilA
MCLIGKFGDNYMNIMNLLKDFVEDESGLTAVEYAIAGGLVVGGMIAAFVTLGDNAASKIECLGDAVNGVGTDCAAAS